MTSSTTLRDCGPQPGRPKINLWHINQDGRQSFHSLILTAYIGERGHNLWPLLDHHMFTMLNCDPSTPRDYDRALTTRTQFWPILTTTGDSDLKPARPEACCLGLGHNIHWNRHEFGPLQTPSRDCGPTLHKHIANLVCQPWPKIAASKGAITPPHPHLPLPFLLPPLCSSISHNNLLSLCTPSIPPSPPLKPTGWVRGFLPENLTPLSILFAILEGSAILL